MNHHKRTLLDSTEPLIQIFVNKNECHSYMSEMMQDNKIYFIGLLANTDPSILKLKLQKDFEIKSISYEDVHDAKAPIGAFLNAKKYHEMTTPLSISLSNDENFYFIYNSFDAKCDLENKEERHKGLNAIAEFDDEKLPYLESTLRLMRLFKEGNIHMPICHYFTMSGNKPREFGSRGTTIYSSYFPKYSLLNHEVMELQQFLERTKLPFRDFIQLAFENFELSYNTHKREIAFLSLAIALETLFNKGKEHELAYSIARNAAVLLGDDKDDSEEVFEDIKNLYNKRGLIVHSGETSERKPLTEDDLLRLRNYVRHSIKEICAFDKSKRDFLAILNSNSYGSKPFRML